MLAKTTAESRAQGRLNVLDRLTSSGRQWMPVPASQGPFSVDRVQSVVSRGDLFRKRILASEPSSHITSGSAVGLLPERDDLIACRFQFSPLGFTR